MPTHLKALCTTSILFCGAIFGFFYAWVCSTMWGLDNADPRIAISAMQAMNASVRNGVFAPAFFGTPLVLAITSSTLWISGNKVSATLMATSMAVYFLFGLLLTMMVNVPMNEMLSQIAVPDTISEAKTIWEDYSAPWQFWNQMRTIASGLALFLAITSVLSINTKTAAN